MLLLYVIFKQLSNTTQCKIFTFSFIFFYWEVSRFLLDSSCYALISKEHSWANLLMVLVNTFDICSGVLWLVVEAFIIKVTIKAFHEWRKVPFSSGPQQHQLSLISDLSQADMSGMKSQNRFGLHYSVDCWTFI